MMHLRATDLTYSHGAETVLDGVSISVRSGMRVGVTGPNGCGKTTLLRILAGELAPRSGSLSVRPSGLLVGLVAQEPERSAESVGERLARRTGVSAAEAELTLASNMYGASDEGPDRYSRALEAFDAVGAADFEARTAIVLADVGLDLDLNVDSLNLSGGELARVELATVMLHKAPLLLLDEPTNSLDVPGLRRLQHVVMEPGRAVVLVSHDRAFLEAVVTDVVEIDAHTRASISHHGGWLAYEQDRATARRQAEELHDSYLTQREDRRSQSQRQRGWSARGASAAKRSSEPDKNIKAEKLASAERRGADARRTLDRLERLEPVTKPFEGWKLQLELGESERGSAEVVTLTRARLDFGGFVMGPIDLSIRAGDRVLLSGDNGSGKSSLLGLVLGDLTPDEGTVRIGPSVEIGSLKQERRRFRSGTPLLHQFCDAMVAEPEVARSVLAKFGLTAHHVERPGWELSAGERTRVALAGFQHRGANFLVLDEPTNHLDVEAIEQLESALKPFGGTLLVVSHDRRFREALDIDREIHMDHGRLSQ